MTTVLLCGEANPYTSEPLLAQEHALFPWPREAAGNRLRLILGLSDREYMRLFKRANMLVGPGAQRWSIVEARNSAHLLRSFVEPDVVVALGRRVANAWASAYGVPVPGPFEQVAVEHAQTKRFLLVAIPHPSGRCREWNEPGARERARGLVMAQVQVQEGTQR